jgi:hypothetical protein
MDVRKLRYKTHFNWKDYFLMEVNVGTNIFIEYHREAL